MDDRVYRFDYILYDNFCYFGCYICYADQESVLSVGNAPCRVDRGHILMKVICFVFIHPF